MGPAVKAELGKRAGKERLQFGLIGDVAKAVEEADGFDTYRGFPRFALWGLM
jgi:hypothetical protein